MSDELVGTVIDIFFVAYGIILVAGTAMTLVFLFALVRGRKMLSQWPFYKIVWSMTWMDSIYLAYQLIWQFPQMAFEHDDSNASEAHDDTKVYKNPNYHSKTTTISGMVQPAPLFILNVLNLIPPKGILYFSLLMALNRLAVFINSPISPIFAKVHGLFRDYVGWTTVGCYALIFTLSVYTELLAPPYKFNRTTLRYEMDGLPIIDSPFLHGINNLSDFVIPFVIVIVYIVVYIVIRKKRTLIASSSTSTTGASSSSRTRAPDDRKLLFQAIVITSFLQLSNITSVLNYVYEGNGWLEYLINIVDMITSALNHSVHSTIFLLSNPTIRSLLPRPTLAEFRTRLRCS